MHIDQEIGEDRRLSLSLTTESTQAAQATDGSRTHLPFQEALDALVVELLEGDAAADGELAREKIWTAMAAPGPSLTRFGRPSKLLHDAMRSLLTRRSTQIHGARR
jgi:hypothetical protein